MESQTFYDFYLRVVACCTMAQSRAWSGLTRKGPSGNNMRTYGPSLILMMLATTVVYSILVDAEDLKVRYAEIIMRCFSNPSVTCYGCLHTDTHSKAGATRN